MHHEDFVLERSLAELDSCYGNNERSGFIAMIAFINLSAHGLNLTLDQRFKRAQQRFESGRCFEGLQRLNHCLHRRQRARPRLRVRPHA